MDLRHHQIVEWKYTTGLTNGQVLTVPLAMENSPNTVAAGSDLLYATFSIFSTLTCTVTLQGSMTAGFTVPETLATLAIAAATFTTAYALPAAFATDGRILITLPHIRWIVADTAAAAHAVTEFYGKAWI